MNSSSEPTTRMKEEKIPTQWSDTELLGAYDKLSFKPVSHEDAKSILISFLAAYSGKFSPSCQLGELVKTAAVLLPARRSEPLDWKAASDPKQLLFGDRFFDAGNIVLAVPPTTPSSEEIERLKAGYQHEPHSDTLLRKRHPRKTTKATAPSPEENGATTTTTAAAATTSTTTSNVAGGEGYEPHSDTLLRKHHPRKTTKATAPSPQENGATTTTAAAATTSNVAGGEGGQDPLSTIIEELQSTDVVVHWRGRKKTCFLAAVVSRLCVKTVSQVYNYIKNTARESIVVYGAWDSNFPPLPHPSFLHQFAADFKRNSPHQVELYTLLVGKYTLLKRGVEATPTDSASRQNKADEIFLLNALCLTSTSLVGLRMIPLLEEVLKKAQVSNAKLQVDDVLQRAVTPETLSSCRALWHCLAEFATEGKAQHSWRWCRLIRDSALPNLRIQDNPLLASMFIAFLAKTDGDKSPLWEMTTKKGVTAAHKTAGAEWAAGYWSELESELLRRTYCGGTPQFNRVMERARD